MNTCSTIVTIAAVVCLVPAWSAQAAAPIQWKHLSSKTGDLPVPGTSPQQTAAVVADLDKSGKNGFVLGFRAKAPALVWYRPTATGWDRYVIEKDFLTIEAGGAVYDIDGDGYPDLVFGGDWQSNKVWWWRNPGKEWKPDVSWERHTIKKSGATQHHDQCFADFKGTGKAQLAFWNQGAKTLFVADIPANPRKIEEWPLEVVAASVTNPGTPTPKAFRPSTSTATAGRSCWRSTPCSSTWERANGRPPRSATSAA